MFDTEERIESQSWWILSSKPLESRVAARTAQSSAGEEAQNLFNLYGGCWDFGKKKTRFEFALAA